MTMKWEMNRKWRPLYRAALVLNVGNLGTIAYSFNRGLLADIMLVLAAVCVVCLAIMQNQSVQLPLQIEKLPGEWLPASLFVYWLLSG